MRRRASAGAGLQTDLAQLRRELHDAQEQQTATADVLKVISRSTFDLQTVLDTLVQSAARLCQDESAFLFRREGDDYWPVYQLVASYGFSEDYVEYMKANPIIPGRGTLVGRTALEGHTVHIPDCLADAEYDWPESQRRGKYRTMLGVPLMREGNPIGVLALTRSQVRPFSDKQIELVMTFADQALIAIENTRLLSELRQREVSLRDSEARYALVTEAATEGIYEWNIAGNDLHLSPRLNELFGFERGELTSQNWIERVHPDERETYRRAVVSHFKGSERHLHCEYRILIKSGEYRWVLDHAVAVRNQAGRAVRLVGSVSDISARKATEMALRELTHELTESLEQQTATSEVLKIISSSPGELEPVFNAMLDNAVRLCEAKTGNLFLYDGAAFHTAALHRASPAYAEARRRPVLVSDLHPNVPFARLARTKEVTHIADAGAEPSYIERDPRMIELVDFAGARTVLVVPMPKDDRLIGAFTIYRQEVRPFTDKQIELVQNFANQAVIAIENARLLNELRHRTDDLTESLEQQTATSNILSVISNSLDDTQPVFNAIVQSGLKLFPGAAILLALRDQDQVKAAAVAAPDAARAEAMRRIFPIPLVREHMNGIAILDRRIVDIPDARNGPPELAVGTRNFLRSGNRATTIMPMLRGDVAIGALSVVRVAPGPISDKQRAILKTFADQAVIAIENARLFNELRESLEQQTAATEVLGVISSAPGELEPVFHAILDNATRICQAKFAHLFFYEGKEFRGVSTRNVPQAWANYLKQNPILIDPRIPLGRVVQTKQIVHVADARTDEGYIERCPGMVGVVELGGARTLLLVPMLRDNELVGVIAMYRQEVLPFTDKQIALMENFAAQAVIAVQNARLLTELRARTDELARSVGELRALGEVSQAVNSTLDAETVLRTIVTKAVELSTTDAGAIYVFDDDQQEFRLRATYGMSEAMIAAISDRHIGMADANIGAAAQRREPIQIADLREAPAAALNDIILGAGYRALLVVPLLGPGRVVGALVVRRREPGAFPLAAVGLLQTFADQSALAIQNARLFDNVETRTHELTKSLEDLRTAQDRLVQTEKLASLGQLTAGIAHEIKNPLNFVNNFSGVSVELIDELREALQQVAVDEKTRADITELSDTLRDNLRKIVQHGKRADSIVKNMLLHSRQGSGERRLTDVNALVEESLNLAYHGARAEKQGFNITLQRSFDPAAGEIAVFPQEIMRVLLNLIGNGFYAAAKRQVGSGEGFEPTLAAATRTLGDRIEICIRDNGTGIPPEVKEKMFNPFFTTKPAGEGTGLGLSISHDIIVKQHSGVIEVDTQPGEFTEFRIILPRTAT